MDVTGTIETTERTGSEEPVGAGCDAPAPALPALDRERDTLLYVLGDISTLSQKLRAWELFARYSKRLAVILQQRENVLRAAATGAPTVFSPTHLAGAERRPVRTIAVVNWCAFVVDAAGRVERVHRQNLLPYTTEWAPVAAAETAPPAPPPAGAWVQPPAAEWVSPTPVPAPVAAPSPRVHREGPTAGAVLGAWLRQVGTLVASQVAVDGLAYLGVLLTFTGTLGYVLVAYETVSNVWLRTCAPLVMPLALAGASIRLQRRGSEFMSSVLAILSAALLPVILSGSISTAMPSATGVALRTAMAVALAAAYAVLAWRRPSSVLRFAVVPMLWVAVWTATLMLHGNAYSADQVAATASFLLLTVAASRVAPRLPFAEPTRVAAVVGTGVVVVLALLFAATNHGPAASILLTGAAAMATVELLAGRAAPSLPLSLLQSCLLAASVGAVVVPLGAAGAGLVAVVGAAALLAWQEVRRPQAPALIAPLVLVLTGLLMTVGEAWPQLVAAGLVCVAAHTRWLGLWRQRSAVPEGWVRAVIPAASVVSAGLLAGAAWNAMPHGAALALLAALTSVLALVGALRRTRDVLHVTWVAVAAIALVASTAAARGTIGDGQLAAVAVLAAVTLAALPLWTAARVWSSSAVAAWASVLLFDAAGLATTGRSAAWGSAALAAVIVASALRGRAAGQLALVGHAAGALALAMAQPGVGTVVTLGTWTGGWAWTVVNAETRGAPLGEALRPLLARTRHPEEITAGLPAVLLVGCVPALLIQLLDLAGVSASHRSWVGVALGVMALAYATVARRVALRQPVAGITTAAAVALSAIAITVSAPDINAVIATVAGSVLVIVIMGRVVRRPFMTWFAWTMGVVLVLLLASRAGVAAGALYAVLIVTGAVLQLGALFIDEHVRGGDGAEGMLRHGWAVHPAAVGALALPVGLALGFHDAPSTYGWWALTAAGVYLAAALLLRTGALSGVGWALAAFAVGALLPIDVVAQPEVLIVFSAALVAGSFVLSRVSEQADPWLRWDIPPLVVAHLVAVMALCRAVAVDAVAVTWAAYAGLALVVAAWRRHAVWAAAAAPLLLVAGMMAGHGWSALALGVTAVGAGLSAARTAGTLRAALQWTCAAATTAAWAEALAWGARATGEEVAATALVSATGALVLAMLVRSGRVGVDWVWSCGTAATAGLGIAALSAAWADQARIGHLGTAGALAVYAIATASLSGRPLQWWALRWVTVLAVAAACIEALAASEWSAPLILAVAAALAGTILVVAALALRAGRLPNAWTLPVAAPSTGVLVMCAVSRWLSVVSTHPDARVAALGVGGGMLLLSAAALLVRPHLPWPGLGWVTCAAAGWGWTALISAADWPAVNAAGSTTLAAGAAALAAAALVRRRVLTTSWAGPVGTLAGIGVAAGSALVVQQTLPGSRHPWGIAAAAGIALLAAGVGVAAAPLARPALRSTCAILAFVSLAMVAYDVQPTIEQAVTMAVAAGLMSLAVALLARWRWPASRWLLPLGEAAVLAAVAALALAPAAWPARGPLITATLMTAAEAAAAGVVLRRPAPLYMSPILACAAWFLFATQSLGTEPNWLSSAIGVTLLAVVEIGRWDRRRGTLPGNPTLTGSALLALDHAGMAFLVAASLVETVLVSPWFGLLGVGLGVVLCLWAALTHVRHRLEFGAAVVLLSLVLLLVAPLTTLAAEMHGFGFWGVLAAIGLALLVIAAVAEQARDRLAAGVHRFENLTRGWQ